MSKPKFFVDMDLTIVDSVKAFCQTYNIIYFEHPYFVPSDPDKLISYDFRCICPLLQTQNDKDKIWGCRAFFAYLEFIDKDTYDVLKKLNEKYQLIIVTIGTLKNLALKSEWLETNLPFIKDCILITNEGNKMDKSIVNMNGALFLDDIPSNLESTNAERKILFGKIYPWNENWQGEHCLTWKEIEQMFL